MFLQINTPVPHDIPLDLPLPEWLLVTLLILSFLTHIIFVNLMVGGSLITLWAQIRGLKDKEYDTYAHEIAKTITVNKSIAVVLGVAPLLSINALYTLYFYSANALTGFAWIMIIPLVTVAFLLTYLHKYSWKQLEQNKGLHITIMAMAVLIFLTIPLIFLTNVNLMMFPEKWGTVKGFLSAMTLPNVIPRYFEFIGACITVTGMFTVWYNGRSNYPVEELYARLDRYALKRIGYAATLTGLGLQILFGAIVLFTLPSKGLGFGVIGVMLAGGLLLALAAWMTWKRLTGNPYTINDDFRKILTCIVVFMVLYGGSRQMFRHNALDRHQQLVAAHTAAFQQLSKEAREHPVAIAAPEIDTTLGEAAQGAVVFQQNCSSCHKPDVKLVGPPVKEMAQIYKDNVPGLKQWIKSPGKKRAGFPQMPAFAQLSEEELTKLSQYILSR